METAVGVVLGVIATVLVSRYYFLRTVNKSLGVYRLLYSFVFTGIAPDVRKLLHFRFQDIEVDELQQLVFLVANDGDKSISGVIQPLTLTIPLRISILDASILYRHPQALEAEIHLSHQEHGSSIAFHFPLLNKGDFFVVKLLLSGSASLYDLSLNILADDLPRSIPIRTLPPRSIDDKPREFEWGLAGIALVILLLPTWICYVAYHLHQTRPEVFPYPWTSFAFSMESLFLLVPGAVLFLLFALLGLMMLGAAAFGGEFPPSGKPHFPLPKELREVVFPYQNLHFPSAIEKASTGAARSDPE